MVSSQVWVPLLIALPMLAFWAYCAADFARTPERDVRLFDRQTWLLILVFANVFGGALWMLRGRPQPPGSLDGQTRRRGP